MSVSNADRPDPQMTGVPRWPALVALVVVAGLLALVSDQLTVVPSWVPLAVVLILIVPIVIFGILERHESRRRIGIIAIGTVTLAVASSAALLVVDVIRADVPPGPLLFGAGTIWTANLITFAIWYWEIDGGGPARRRRDGHISTDFLFPQLQIGDGTTSHGWWPGFLDYLFVAFNASTAFSPTDTLILSRRAKVLMMVQSMIAIVTVVVIAARAVNTLH